MIRSAAGVPQAVVDWKEFYRLRRHGVHGLIGSRKLLSNIEARDTGLLSCEYLKITLSKLSNSLALFLTNSFSNETIARKRRITDKSSIWRGSDSAWSFVVVRDTSAL